MNLPPECNKCGGVIYGRYVATRDRFTNELLQIVCERCDDTNFIKCSDCGENIDGKAYNFGWDPKKCTFCINYIDKEAKPER